MYVNLLGKNMVQDSISDFIIRLKNSGDAGKESVSVPYSKMIQKIAELLEKQGYIKAQTKKGKKVAGQTIEVNLLPKEANGPRIQGVKRHSKPSKRVYVHSKDIYPVRHGYGMLVVSTSKGLMSGDEARKAKLGGEVLFEIW